MDYSVVNLDIDGSVFAQKTLLNSVTHNLSLRHLEPQLRLWANRKGLTELREHLQTLRTKEPLPWLTFLGSGDLHHLSSLLLETLPQDLHPVALILVDNHPDWFRLPPKYHCGNWVSNVLRFPWIESITMIGQDSPDLKGLDFWSAPFNELCSGRIKLYPYEKSAICVPFRWPRNVQGARNKFYRPWGTEIHFDTVQSVGCSNLFRQIAKRYAGKNIYISIDKDCLAPQFAITDWEQGQLTLEELTEGISQLKSTCTVVGMDICGERAPNKLSGIFKRLDAGRMAEKSEQTWSQINSHNEKTNLILHETLCPNVQQVICQ